MASQAQRLLDSLREAVRFAPVRPAIAAGLRAGIATIVPLLLSSFLAQPLLSWTVLGGFLTSIVDKGGAYRTRAAVMLGAAAAGAVGSSVAALAGNRTDASIAFAFVAATLLGFVRVFGASASSIGSSSLVLILVSLARPEPALLAALERGLFSAAGGLWAMGLSLLLWPVRVYRPARNAVAAYLRAVAAYVAAVARFAEEPVDGDASSGDLLAHRAAVRQAIEEARATLAATRRGLRGESGRGARLLVVLESGDRIVVDVLALSELVASSKARGAHPSRSSGERAVALALADLGAMLDALASVVETEGASPPITLPPWDLTALEAPPSAQGGALDVGAAERAHAAALLARLHARATEAAAIAATLADERPPEGSAPRADLDEELALAAPLRDNLTLRSSALRHALRLGATTAAAAALTHLFALPRGYWVTIAVAVILQPQVPATFLKATQRVAGTVIGGVLTAGLLTAVAAPGPTMAVVLLMTVVSVSLQPINYGLFAVFLTPAFVLLAEINAREPGLVGTRIVNTLIGGALALATSRLLWPTRERDLFPSAAAAALRAARGYIHVAAATGPLDEAALDRARRDVGLALLNAEASLNRWMAEARGGDKELEAPMALLVYARGFTAAAVALASAREEEPEALDLAPFAAEVERVLADLERALEEGRPPAQLPPLEASVAEAIAAAEAGCGAEVAKRRRVLLRALLSRLIEPLAVQRDAVERWLSASPSPR